MAEMQQNNIQQAQNQQAQDLKMLTAINQALTNSLMSTQPPGVQILLAKITIF